MIDQETQKAIAKMIANKTVNHIIKHSCGEKLGAGSSRTAYEVKGFPQVVFKFERDNSQALFSNVTEWRNWEDNKRWQRLAPWLAPCYGISEFGQVLVQERVEFRERAAYPKVIPSMFADTKYKNFGWIGEQFVCCDYSFFIMCDFQMKRVIWKP